MRQVTGYSFDIYFQNAYSKNHTRYGSDPESRRDSHYCHFLGGLTLAHVLADKSIANKKYGSHLSIPIS